MNTDVKTEENPDTATTVDTAPTVQNPPGMDTKRDALRQKIEASERRISERSLADQAREAADAAIDYTKANPLTVVGGAIVAGIAIGLMTKPGRRVAGRAATSVAAAATGAAGAISHTAAETADTVGDAASKSASWVNHTLADTVVAYAAKLVDEVMDGARAGQDKLEDFGDSASAKARDLRRDARYYAASAADKGRTASRRTRRRADRAARDVAART